MSTESELGARIAEELLAGHPLPAEKIAAVGALLLPHLGKRGTGEEKRADEKGDAA